MNTRFQDLDNYFWHILIVLLAELLQEGIKFFKGHSHVESGTGS